jgi:hypothetical protein
MTWLVGLLVGFLPGLATGAAKNLMLYVALGLGAATLGGLAAYHIVTVRNAYEQGASAAREQCAKDANAVKQKAYTAYALLAKRLQAQLDTARAQDDKAGDDDNTATGSLEAVLAKQKTDPECWSANVVKELQR